MNNDQEDPTETFRTRMPRKYRIGLLLVGAGTTTLGITGMVSDGLVREGVLLALPVALLVVAIVRMQAVVQLDAEEVRISVARIFKTSIPYHRIDGVQLAEATGLAAGMGLRIMPNSTTGYLVGGPAVRISTGSTGVLVSTDAPTELADAIEGRRSRQVRRRPSSCRRSTPAADCSRSRLQQVHGTRPSSPQEEALVRAPTTC